MVQLLRPLVTLAFLVSATLATDQSEKQNLRRTPEVKVLGESRIRIVLRCVRTYEECLERLEEFDPSDVQIVHKLTEVESWAVSVGESDEVTMEALEVGNYFDISSDTVRKPMYIKESVQVEDGRNLQFWNSQDVPYGIDMVKARQVWETYGARGQGIRVCVMDTGIRGDHEDFVKSRLSGYSGREAVTPWDNDGNGHGTHVSGTIAAADNDEGVVGVAPDAEIYTVRVFDNEGFFFGSDVVAAATACRNAGAKIISMSLGGPSYDGDEKRIFENLYDQGILAIAAAGNDGDGDYSFPASYSRVMSVAAVNSNRRHASFSQYNDRVDIAAPGVNVRSTWNNGRYSSISGTSMATPHVSGVAALLLSHKPDASPEELFNAMTSTAENPNTPGRDDKLGHGIINAMAAIQAIGGGNGGLPNDDNGENCSNNEIDLVFKLQTDDYGYETSWTLSDLTSGATVALGSEGTYANNVDVTTRKCLSRGNCYSLTIDDSYGDGICCGQRNPGFEVHVDGQLVQGNQDFKDSITISGIGNCASNSGGNSPSDPPASTPTNPPESNPTSPPVNPPTSPPVNPPTPPPTQRECCFLWFCWNC